MCKDFLLKLRWNMTTAKDCRICCQQSVCRNVIRKHFHNFVEDSSLIILAYSPTYNWTNCLHKPLWHVVKCVHASRHLHQDLQLLRFTLWTSGTKSFIFSQHIWSSAEPQVEAGWCRIAVDPRILRVLRQAGDYSRKTNRIPQAASKCAVEI